MRDMKYYNSFWYKFTLPIKRAWFKHLLNKEKLVKVDDRHRGIGKTYMTIDKAISQDIPIIVGTQTAMDNIRRTANVVEVYGLAKNFTIQIEGREFPNGVLIDETVNPDILVELEKRNIRIRGGFIRDNKGDKKNEAEKNTSTV